jgi:hypothetical protein
VLEVSSALSNLIELLESPLPIVALMGEPNEQRPRPGPADCVQQAAPAAAATAFGSEEDVR